MLWTWLGEWEPDTERWGGEGARDWVSCGPTALGLSTTPPLSLALVRGAMESKQLGTALGLQLQVRGGREQVVTPKLPDPPCGRQPSSPRAGERGQGMAPALPAAPEPPGCPPTPASGAPWALLSLVPTPLLPGHLRAPEAAGGGRDNEVVRWQGSLKPVLTTWAGRSCHCPGLSGGDAPTPGSPQWAGLQDRLLTSSLLLLWLQATPWAPGPHMAPLTLSPGSG